MSSKKSSNFFGTCSKNCLLAPGCRCVSEPHLHSFQKESFVVHPGKAHVNVPMATKTGDKQADPTQRATVSCSELLLQLSAFGPETGPPGKCRLKWVDGRHRKAVLAGVV
jgi:hypothetical protein